VEENLAKVRNAGTEQDLGIQYKALKPEVDKLNMMAAKRQQELKDVQHKEQMAAARGVLQRNVPLLYTASRACLQHPDVAAYKANRELIYKQLQQAVSGISNTAQGVSTEDSGLGQHTGPGELAGALNNFDRAVSQTEDGWSLSVQTNEALNWESQGTSRSEPEHSPPEPQVFWCLECSLEYGRICKSNSSFLPWMEEI
ncbi:catenin alpha-1, partial [Tachysurus ichikawai]